MFFKKIIIIFILLVFYQTTLYSKSSSFDNFDSSDSAIEAMNGIYQIFIKIGQSFHNKIIRVKSGKANKDIILNIVT